MRSLTLLVLAALMFVAIPLRGDEPDKAVGKGRPERTLECSGALPGGCDVSCVSTSGTVLFVHANVQRAYITEFAGSHTLLELQKSAPQEIMSVLVGDISHCMLNGLRDPSLLPRGGA